MNINLARKWRSKDFDEIVGQPLAVRLIKNSLYRNLLFPVYLLSGTRGTGKTTMARLFAAALNCAQLKAFQEDPQQHTLPCLACESCKAMRQMNHPDFIEIDAASHTGVDNVRQIIEAASFVPVMGTKKIYLIDEAHMLSKAAFNAFLKILEEPPKTVVFLLATTDPHKIIQTVTSRCFQIFFDPIKPSAVVEHLEFICQQESLQAESEALMLIAQETQGSMRDALNLLERLRALPDVLKNDAEPAIITKQMVLSLLGSIDDDRVGELLLTIVSSDVPAVLATWERLEIARYTPALVWKKFVETLGRALWLKQGTVPDEMPVSDSLAKVAEQVSYKRLVEMLDLCYSYELTFAKTAVPSTLLEVLLLKMVSQGTVQPTVQSVPEKKTPLSELPIQAKLDAGNRGQMSPTVSTQEPPILNAEKSVEKKETLATQGITQATVTDVSIKAESVPQETVKTDSGPWTGCLAYLEKISDPLVLSIFRQSTQQIHKNENATLEVTFSHDLGFFKDWLSNTKKVWQPAIDQFFGENTQLVPLFTGPSAKLKAFSPVVSKVSVEQITPAQKIQAPVKSVPESVGKRVTKDDLASLEKGALILEAFPGLLLATDRTPVEGA